MEFAEIAQLMDGGTLHLAAGPLDASTLPWNEHPAFEGVALKHLVTGAETAGALSCHMVRVAPGCTLAMHAHAAQWELHEVISGSGTAQLDETEMPYAPGTLTIIPKGTDHRVAAGDDGLVLLAKFFPALL
ncbi:quercetin dioxygenase-like cupin family protein [Desulfobaculum xiamenense]|uniref:Quercetin dioxygenase-like cupin family protein n=1 Tax=Desulfobaculum xiamenense TaxID=995050 RepID=A0A846QDU3_9BACT|nr:cupin domain-containing protein [Desulfobaculum xiamenense]NJB66548.1 quercetin dioxygenase-like cupin family protein [Desulfobaculum xiamenense]